MRLGIYKSETVISLDMKLSALTSNKTSSSYDQNYADLIKFPLLKSPEKFPCIKIHQTSIFHDPGRQRPSSDSKIVGCHPL